MLGMGGGIHPASIMAAPARVAVILGDLTVGIDAGSGSPSYTSTGWTETTMGTDEVQTLKDNVDANIDEQITPTSETKTIPEE
jgi:hypothetical protein